MYSTHDVLHYSGHNFTNKQTNKRGWIHYLRQTYTVSIKFTLKANKIVSIIITITWQKHYAFASSCSKLYNLRQKKNVHIITIIIFFLLLLVLLLLLLSIVAERIHSDISGFVANSKQL